MDRERSAASWGKIKHFAATQFGYGIKSEATSKDLVYRMKGKDLKRILWYACQYHCSRIYRGIFTFGAETVNVRTEYGELRGRKLRSAVGRTYYSFQGVPYAKPPIGALRFKDPQPPEPWTGVRDALKEGSVCIHKDVISGFVKGSENCLFLNIYTPYLPEKGVDGEKKAVMFWIHGGGFQLGSGNGEIYGPDFFVSEDVILVTINYRLGALGFLSTGTDDAPGNYGMKDMVLALKWVKGNVASFGGDPDRITVFGESAGAAAVQYLMLSKTSKGLFHRAICQSGSAACNWSFNPSTAESAFKLGRAFGIASEDPSKLVAGLRKIPAKVIATKQNTALSEQRKRECVPLEFCVCAEPETYPNAFLTKSPRELIEAGDVASDVPCIAGINEMEGMIILKNVMDKRPPASDIDKDLERLVPSFLNLGVGSEESKEVAAKIRDFYFRGKAFDKTKYKEYVDYCTDSHFLEGFLHAAKHHVKYLRSPVYAYMFLFEGQFNLFKKILNIREIPGPCHSDELFYMFHVPILGQNLDPKTPEMRVSKKLVRLWSNFAKFGNPTPDAGDADLDNVVWPAYDDDRDRPYLVIDSRLSVERDMLAERRKFWDDLKERYGAR